MAHVKYVFDFFDHGLAPTAMVLSPLMRFYIVCYVTVGFAASKALAKFLLPLTRFSKAKNSCQFVFIRGSKQLPCNNYEL